MGTTTTDGFGAYNFLNLAMGHYVIVQTPLPGYVSSSPINGEISLNITNLAPYTNNFLQFQVDPTNYGTLGGNVYYNTNGFGTNTPGQIGIENVTINLVQDLNTNGLADPGEPTVSSTTTDTNGNATSSCPEPAGHYVIQQVLLFGYYSTGDGTATNNNQIPINLTGGLTTTNNNFYDRLLPTAVNDTYSEPRNLLAILMPLTNDISPNGDPLTITNAVTTNGSVIITGNSTNLEITPRPRSEPPPSPTPWSIATAAVRAPPSL